MGELNFKVKIDDKEARERLKRLAKDASKDLGATSVALVKETANVNKTISETIKLTNKETDAIRKRNNEVAKRPVQKRPVDMGNSQAEIDAYLKSRNGNIKGGTVAGPNALIAPVIDRATNSQTKFAAETKKATSAIVAESLAIDGLKAELVALKLDQGRTTNPVKLTAINRQIEQTTLEIARMENAGKKGFDSIGNAAVKSGNGIQRAIQGLFRMAYLLPGIGVAGLLAFAIDPIVAYLAQLDMFKSKLGQLSANLSAFNEINREAFKSAGSDISSLRILYKTATDVSIATHKRVSAAKELQKLYPKSFSNSSTQSILNGKESATIQQLTKDIIANAKAKAVINKLADIEAKRLEILMQKDKIRNANVNEKKRGELEAKNAQEALNKTYSKQQERFKLTGDQLNRNIEANVFKPSDQRATEAIKLQDEHDKILAGQAKYLKKFIGNEKLAEAIIGDPKKVNPVSAENQYQSALAKRLDLVNSINAASEEATAKGLLEEDNDLAASEAKYKKMREDVVEFNKWVDRYNATHLKKISKVVTDQIDIAETNDREAILDKQAKGQYEKYKELRESLLNHTQQIERIQKEHQDKLQALGSATPEQAAELQKQTDAKINAVKDEAFQTSSIYKKLNEDIAYYSKEQTKVQIASIEEFLKGASNIPPELRERLAGQLATAKANLGKSGDDSFIDNLKEQKAGILQVLSSNKLSTEEYERQYKKLQDINQEIDKATKAKFGKMADILRNVSSMALDMASSLEGVNGAIGGMLSGLSEVASIAKDAFGSIASFASGDIMGGISGAVSAIGGMIRMHSVSKEVQAEQARRTAEYYRNVFAGEKEYARMMRSRQSIQENITELTIKELNARKEMLSGQTADAQDDYEEILKRIQDRGRLAEEKQGTGRYERRRDGSSINRSIDNAALLNTDDYDALEKLYTEGRMSEGAKALFEQLKKAKEELDGITEQSKEADLVLQKIRTGTTASDLSNTLLDMFRNGKTGVQDFADFFQNTMQDAIFSTFKNDVINKEMDAWYKEFDIRAKDGVLDSADQTALQERLKEIDAKGKSWLDNMQKATGVDLSGKAATTGATGLQGAIRREMTESTASELTGLFRGQFDVTKRLLAATSDGFAKSHDIAMGGIRHLQAIEANTANTVGRLDLVVSRLDAVVSNTKPTTTGRGLGLP